MTLNQDNPDTPAQPEQRLSFKARHRLTHARQFQAAFDAKVRRHRGPIAIFVVPNQCSHSRLGLSIGARVGSAVVRNRLKRLLREAFRLEQYALPTWKSQHDENADPHSCTPFGYDIVISAKPHALWTLAAYRKVLWELAVQAHEVWQFRCKEQRS